MILKAVLKPKCATDQ